MIPATRPTPRRRPRSNLLVLPTPPHPPHPPHPSPWETLLALHPPCTRIHTCIRMHYAHHFSSPQPLSIEVPPVPKEPNAAGC